jgi:hypothetical protein
MWSYCHGIGVIIDGVWMVIGFIEHLEYNSWLFFTNHCHTLTSVLNLLVSISRRLVSASNADVPLLLCFQTLPCLSYQLLTATTHKVWRICAATIYTKFDVNQSVVYRLMRWYWRCFNYIENGKICAKSKCYFIHFSFFSITFIGNIFRCDKYSANSAREEQRNILTSTRRSLRTVSIIYVRV